MVRRPAAGVPPRRRARGGRPAKNGGGGGAPLAASRGERSRLYGGNARAGAGPDAVESREEDDRDIMDGRPAFVAEAKAAARGAV